MLAPQSPASPLFSTRSVAFLILLLALLAVGRERMLHDPGALWHTVVGERILERGELPATDEFSFTFAGRPWIAQQWLAECIMALAHRAARLDALLLLAALILAATYASIADRLRRAGIAAPGIILLVAVVMAASSHHFHARPHIATIALASLNFGLLCDVEAGRASSRRLWLLPPLIALWANLHGGALAGVLTCAIVLLTWTTMLAVGSSVIGPSIARRRCILLIFLALLCGAAVLVNPYGDQLPRVWLSLMGSQVLPALITEHGPLDADSIEGIMVLALAFIYLIVLASTWQRMLRVTWLMPALWLFLAVSRVRHTPLFAIIAAIAIAEMLPHSRLWQSLTRRRSALVATESAPRHERSPRWRTSALPIAAVILIAALQLGDIRIPLIGAGWARLDKTYWPVEAAAALPAAIRSAGDDRVFNQMLYGGYLIYAVPEARIYIDDRCELYGDDVLLQYESLMQYPDKLLAELDHRKLRLALLSTNSPAAAALAENPAWQRLHSDPVASLFSRR